MAWVLIILRLLMAVPSIIKMVEEIVALIHGHPMQALHEHAFLGILQAWHASQDHGRVVTDLEALHAKLAA